MKVVSGSLQIHGNHRCFVCGTNFDWTAIISEGDATAYAYGNNVVVGEFIAIGSVTTSEGPKVQCEINANCPRCRNISKFASQASVVRG